MEKISIILIVGVFIAGTALSQQSPEGVDDIMKRLSASAEPIASVEGQSEVVVLAPEEIPAAVEKSRELYVRGEFEIAQAGFNAVIKADPDNVIAQMYLRCILERDARRMETAAMDALSDAWDTRMVLRSYPVSTLGVEKLQLTNAVDQTDITIRFPDVDFPEGASAVYHPKTKKLFVRNTRENLAVLEEVLHAMDISRHKTEIDQVEIEAKFVEVSEGTLEELGFEWDFANSIDTGVDDVIINDQNGLFAEALRGSSLNPSLPFGQPGSLLESETSASGDWTAFRFEDTFNTTPGEIRLQNNGSNPLEILISALDQSAGTDVLSAPRVVTRSGETAIIRAGQLHFFPETYGVGANEGNIVHVKYDDFGEKLLGVELEVTPTVDSRQILLRLNPKINELVGWQSYTVLPANASYTYYQYRMGFEFEHDTIAARLPVFKKREIDTTVAIADGSTIGMGGLLNEKIESYTDKVPVLGSLPLIGRLFRNEGQRVVKRNLMMFVTAKKIAPSGRINTARSFVD